MKKRLLAVSDDDDEENQGEDEALPTLDEVHAYLEEQDEENQEQVVPKRRTRRRKNQEQGDLRKTKIYLYDHKNLQTRMRMRTFHKQTRRNGNYATGETGRKHCGKKL